jgi:hypothetical protein
MSAKKRATGGREPRRYEIRVRGPIGPTMMQAFPTLAATSREQDTLLTGSLPDQCALYGVIHQLEALGLELLEIRCLPTSRNRALVTGAHSQQTRRKRRNEHS